jgi:MoaA/NifB/PqqE/SkfB family radical SAM enzyme
MAAFEGVPPAERWAENSVLVAFAFHCNLACTFCMVEDVLNVYEGTTLDAFRRFTARPGALAGVRRIIFSGGEVTLAKNLLEYARLARSLPGIEHVRLQTNATRLHDRKFLATLVDAGIDEYFVSIHGHDAATCDAITQVTGSYDEILAGMRAITEAGAALFTNTAIAAANVAVLPDIVRAVAPLAPCSMEFWNYWPRADEKGARGHFVRIAETRGPLLGALAACVERGIVPVVKWFPRCQLGDYAKYHDDGQPPSVIPDDYFTREPSYACIYEGVCEEAGDLAAKGTPASGRCAGLSEPYIHRFGYEADLLVPRRKASLPLEQGGARPDLSMPRAARSLVRDAGPRRTEAAAIAAWLDHFGIGAGRTLAGWSFASAVRSRDGAMVSLAFQSGARSAVVRICPRDESRRAVARTRSFDLFYSAAGEPGPPESIAQLLSAVVQAISARDDGALTPPRNEREAPP